MNSLNVYNIDDQIFHQMEFSKLKDCKVKYEHKPRVDNLIFRLHYRYTVAFFLVAAVLTTLTELFGTYKSNTKYLIFEL